MAGELNGREGHRARTRALRVVCAPGTGPAAPQVSGDGSGAAPAGAAAIDRGAVVMVDEDGHLAVDGLGQAAVLTDLGAPRARLLLSEGVAGAGGRAAAEDHPVLVLRPANRGRAASGVRRLEVVIDGWRFELDVDSEARARLRERATIARADATRGGPSELRAIIPGRVVSVQVAEGDAVEAGGRLLVLEAMKMQNELNAPRAGTVARVAVGPGQTVELGDLLLVIE